MFSSIHAGCKKPNSVVELFNMYSGGKILPLENALSRLPHGSCFPQ